MHSNVGTKCKNENGILLAEQIIILLQQAGEKVNPRIKASTLIDRVPTFKQTLDQTAMSKDKNIILKRAFTAMYRVLKNNTDVYDYFTDLKIPEITPTVSVLDTLLTFTHKGINKDYKTPASI
ncbi:MAG: hypothetical protein NHB15_06630 [Methanosarcina barkeri]|nr:hypothetical protein [Methanosarcina sp. ERenArc_MAG2]